MNKYKILSGDSLRKILGGTFTIKVFRQGGDIEIGCANNLIVDVGIAQLGDILAGVETTDIDLGFIEPGEGLTTPAPGDTDTEDELEGSPTARLAATVQARNASTPFEVSIEAFLDTAAYTRPQTINEMCVFFTPVGGTLFARGLLDTPVTLNTGDTATINYSIVFK